MDSKYVPIFSLALMVAELFCNFVIVHKIKVSKHIWDPCCPLALESGSLFCPDSHTTCYLSLFPPLHHILLYLFTNISFKFCSLGSVFMIKDDENDTIYLILKNSE